MKTNKTFKLWSSLKSEDQTRIMLFWLIGIAVVISFLSAFQDGQFDWRSIGGNLGTELFGAAITFYIFEKIIEKRDTEQLKQRLIRQMGSTVNHEAKRAAEELRAHGWLGDGSLEGAILSGADLSLADLDNADLRGASMDEAILSSIMLNEAKLQGARIVKGILIKAKLRSANLEQANMSHANLKQADLSNACLRNANLEAAILHHADLSGADMTGANLVGLRFTEIDPNMDVNSRGYRKIMLHIKDTILPNGEQWRMLDDIGRFVSPNHPDFWRSDDPDSPAYRGDDGG